MGQNDPVVDGHGGVDRVAVDLHAGHRAHLHPGHQNVGPRSDAGGGGEAGRHLIAAVEDVPVEEDDADHDNGHDGHGHGAEHPGAAFGEGLHDPPPAMFAGDALPATLLRMEPMLGAALDGADAPAAGADAAGDESGSPPRGPEPLGALVGWK